MRPTISNHCVNFSKCGILMCRCKENETVVGIFCCKVWDKGGSIPEAPGMGHLLHGY